MPYVVTGLVKTDFISHDYGDKPSKESYFVHASSETQAAEMVRHGIMGEQSKLFCPRSIEAVEEVGASRQMEWEDAADVHDIAWEQPWYECDLVAIDVETTGLDPTSDRVIEIGWSRYDFDENAFQVPHAQLVDPETSDIGATDVHGLELEDVQGQPTFEACRPAIDELLEGTIVVAQNRGFDIRFLQHEFDRSNGQVFTMPPSVCTKSLASSMDEFEDGPGLGTLADRLGVTLDDHHRAGADAKACGDVFLELTRRHSYFHPPCTARECVAYFDQLDWPQDDDLDRQHRLL
ncbi:MAG: exonuclease domain-containing protein [Bradymonadaceae bacterium]